MPRYVILRNLRSDFAAFSLVPLGSLEADGADEAVSLARQRFHVVNPSVVLWDKAKPEVQRVAEAWVVGQSNRKDFRS